MAVGKALGAAVLLLAACGGSSKRDEPGKAGAASQAGSGGASGAGAAPSAGGAGGSRAGAGGKSGAGVGGEVAGRAAGVSGAAGEGGAAGASDAGGAGAGQGAASGETAGGSAGNAGGQSGAGNAGGQSGAGNAGGQSGAGNAGAPSGYRECQRNEDCALWQDCCTCAAVVQGEALASCPAICLAGACEAHGITAGNLRCDGGRCIFNLACSGFPPACGEAAPTCAEGSLPSTSGDCWGPCVGAHDCNDVASCEVCEDAGLGCVRFSGGGPSSRCVAIPDECGDNPTCGCVNACTSGSPCSDPGSVDLRCECETC